MRWKTDCHTDISKKMVKGEQVRDLAQIGNIKIVQKLRTEKSCELCKEKFLRDAAKSGAWGLFSLHRKARERGFTGISQRSCCVLSVVRGCWSLLLNLRENVPESRGLHDLLPNQSGIWEKDSSISQEVCSLISSDLWHHKKEGIGVARTCLQNFCKSNVALYNYWSPGEGWAGAIFHFRHWYSLGSLNRPVFHTGSLPSLFCIFDCYVKLA